MKCVDIKNVEFLNSMNNHPTTDFIIQTRTSWCNDQICCFTRSR